ncbi:TonB-dependent receptor [Rubrivirga sp. IMCC45206]|uniref:TonB-dependent receptor n=1 Tax=Rubrivirga sp. IMCC45206 TaxID=3391614 RepID=UPI00398FCCA1
MPLSRRRHARLLALVCLLPASALAQAVGSVTGVVLDADTGAPLAAANVVLPALDRGAVADADGLFRLDAVPAGARTLRASSVGYRDAEQRVTVEAGATTRAVLVLSPADAGLGEVVVEGRAVNLVGTAGSASQGLVGRAQLAQRPLLRVGEVLETIPGAIVTQHSGSGKANQFFLRGFNLDHGTDFAASVEGVPLNLPTHAHGQGYLDLNFLIPELVDEVAFAKGPQGASGGNFSTAGRADIRLKRRLDAPLVQAEAGSDETAAALLAGSTPVGDGTLLVAARGQVTDGPWVNPENGTLASGIARYSTGTDRNGLSLTALAYHNDWDATDQIAARAVPDLYDRLDTVDPTVGGTTSRATLVGRWARTSPTGTATRATAYAATYSLNLFSNFTYFLDDPVRGDQFEQEDRRVYGGADLAHDWRIAGLGRSSRITVGAGLRHDQIGGVGLFRTDARERIGTVRDDAVAETNGSVYGEVETRWTEAVRTTLGVRVDAFRFDVASDRAANSGTRTAALASPKAGVVLGPWADTELYLNAGLGYHSNDARGTVITVDPASGAAVDPVDPLVRTRAAEVGLRTAAVDGLQSTVSLWAIGLDSELVFVGDAGGTEASDASRHVGVEWANYLVATDWLQLALDVALTRSRFLDVPEGEDRIENSLGRVVTGGVYLGRPDGWMASLQVRHLGPRPLTADGAVTAAASTLLGAKVGARVGRVALSADVLNLLDSEAADVSYFYASRLPGEPAAGVDDLHAHPVPPRSVRLTAAVRL